MCVIFMFAINKLSLWIVSAEDNKDIKEIKSIKITVKHHVLCTPFFYPIFNTKLQSCRWWSLWVGVVHNLRGNHSSAKPLWVNINMIIGLFSIHFLFLNTYCNYDSLKTNGWLFSISSLLFLFRFYNDIFCWSRRTNFKATAF